MLLDVLTLLGALYVLLTIVEYLCSLWKAAGTSQNTIQSDPIIDSEVITDKEICDNCGQCSQQAKSKIQYATMASELGAVQQPDHELDQYQSEILKRRKRIAAGEVKGFHMSANENSDGSAIDRRHLNYNTDYTIESDPVSRRSLVKDIKSCDVPSIMVGLSEDADQKIVQWRQQPSAQRSSLDDRRSSLDTVPVKLSAPVTVIHPGGSNGALFRISENSAFTPIQPRRDASLERHAPMLSANAPLHAQSVPDISVSGTNMGSSNSQMPTAPHNAPGPVQITVVMKPITGNSGGQQPVSHKVASTVVWTSNGQSQTKSASDQLSTDNNTRMSDVSEPTTKDQTPTPVQLKMQSNFQEISDPQVDQKNQQTESDSSVKLKLIQPPINTEHDDLQVEKPIRKPYTKSSTTGLASTAALARAMATVNYRNNYYNSLTSKELETLSPYRKQRTPPPPNATELMTPHLLKKQALNETYPRHGLRPYFVERPQMALTQAMRTAPPTRSKKQASRTLYGGALNESTMPQPYHPPTMANYDERLPPSPRAATSDVSRFPFSGSSIASAASLDNVAKNQRQHQLIRYSPNVQTVQKYQEDKPNVVWRQTEGRPALTISSADGHQHSLSVDEGTNHERSRSRERSKVHQQPEYKFDEPTQPSASAHSQSFDFRSSFDEEKSVPREITDQGVPTTEDVLKGGNVSSKTKLFETLAEQELRDADSQLNFFYSQQRKSLGDRFPQQTVQVFSASHLAPTPKHKKMERSHTVHTVRSLMAPDAYQYENAPHRICDQENRIGDQLHQQTPSPRFNGSNAVPPFYGPPKSVHEGQPHSTVVHIAPPSKPEEVIEFPPASVSPRSVQKEHAFIGKGHQFYQARVVQPQHRKAPSPQAQTQSTVISIPAPISFAPQPAPIQIITESLVEPSEKISNESAQMENVYEDEMSKLSIADKAKLFEQKAEEQAQTKKRFVARHKTQPVTTEEVMKARLVFSDHLAKLSGEKKLIKPQRPGTMDEEEAEEQTDEDNVLKRNFPKRNFVIYQRTSDARKSANRLDEITSDKEEHQSSTAPTVKPRRTVFLHAERNNVLESPEASLSDQNNNEKPNKTETVQPILMDFSTMANGCPRQSPPLTSSRPPIKESNDATRENQFAEIIFQEKPGDASKRQSLGVREKAKKLMDEINAKNSAKTGSNPLTDGQLFSRIIVNDEDEINDSKKCNGENGRFEMRMNELDGFCSSAQDLECATNEKVEDESFMSIIKAPMIRLQHFERPKPHRRHSSRGSQGYEQFQSNENRNTAVTVNE